jgi:hypothetical protein
MEKSDFILFMEFLQHNTKKQGKNPLTKADPPVIAAFCNIDKNSIIKWFQKKIIRQDIRQSSSLLAFEKAGLDRLTH